MLAERNSNVMASVSISVRRAREVGGWDASLARGGDWDLWKRALATGARPAATPDVTVLHFRASGRDQPWPDRVRQNTDWLERIGDAEELERLRRAVSRLRGERDAVLYAMIDDRDRQLAHIHATRWWRLRAGVARAIRRR